MLGFFIQFPPKVTVSLIDLLSKLLPNDRIYISALLRRRFVRGKALILLQTTLIIGVAVSFIWLIRLKIT